MGNTVDASFSSQGQGVLIWGFESNILKTLVPTLRQTHPHCIWAGFHHQGAEYDIDEMTKGNIGYYPLPEQIEPIYQKVYQELHYFYNIDWRTQQYYMDKTLYDALDKFNQLFNFIVHLFRTHDIHTIVFSFMPHDSASFMAYKIAKAMGLKTIIFTLAAYFINKAHVIFDIEDFGKLEGIPKLSKTPPPQIEKTFEQRVPSLSYELSRFTSNHPNWWVKFKEPLKKSHFLLAYGHTFLHHRYSFFYWHQSFNRWLRRRASFQKRKAVTQLHPDLTVPFIYFPLHLQPEMVTAVLCKEYYDQVLAIERLAQKLPDGWKIYVKDYPHQSEYQRSESFYDRLLAIPNVTLVGNIPSSALMKACQCVATLVGTAGWEAVCGGKNVIVFGYAWYRTLPGVFEYSDTLSISDVMSYRIDHQDLQEKFEALYCTLADVQVESYHAEFVPQFSIEKNRDAVMEIIQSLI